MYSQSAFVCILQHCLNFEARFESYLFTIYLFVRNMFLSKDLRNVRYITHGTGKEKLLITLFH